MDNKTLKKSAELIKIELGSIDLTNIEELKEEELTDAEYKERAAESELFYKNNFEKILKLLIQKQLEFIGKEATGEGQVVFGRGTINGFIIIQDWFNEQISISQSRFEKEEKIEKGEI